ncbi:iron uptake protein [Uliginosibacterium aquaticum]|uniref:Iron uptake protein n=1 Tax=Uliginosibacterium aquaticum TaxID=2731212 RepID=A0ABX2IB83_9RHOO|nr:iron uptake protein [Uliginosibacterium aquaticum]NSL53433.1 iron uptake protein [Uliginosibacterium aquaticum]
MTRTHSRPLQQLGIALRILAAIPGGWAFSWGFVACGTAALVALGAPFHDAETALLMLGLLVFAGVFLWSFAARSVLRVCAVLVGGALLFNAAALLLQRAILS